MASRAHRNGLRLVSIAAVAGAMTLATACGQGPPAVADHTDEAPRVTYSNLDVNERQSAEPATVERRQEAEELVNRHKGIFLGTYLEGETVVLVGKSAGRQILDDAQLGPGVTFSESGAMMAKIQNVDLPKTSARIAYLAAAPKIGGALVGIVGDPSDSDLEILDAWAEANQINVELSVHESYPTFTLLTGAPTDQRW